MRFVDDLLHFSDTYEAVTRKGPFTPNQSGTESEKDQRTREKDQRITNKHQRNVSLLLGLNGP